MAPKDLIMVGPDRLAAPFTAAYGLVLLAKVVLFLAMFGLAARNRFIQPPPRPALRRLRSSLLLEAALGFGVLGLLGVLGMMAPIASG